MVDLINELRGCKSLYEKLLGDLAISQQPAVKINLCVLSEDQLNYTKIIFQDLQARNHFKKWLAEKRVFILVEDSRGTNVFASSSVAQKLAEGPLGISSKQFKVQLLNDQEYAEFKNIAELVQVKLEETAKREPRQEIFNVKPIAFKDSRPNFLVRLLIRAEQQISKIIFRCIEKISEARRQDEARAQEEAKRKHDKHIEIIKHEIKKQDLKAEIKKEEIDKQSQKLDQ